MTTWRDVERVHKEHPDWTDSEIADELGCISAYVRATGQRRGFIYPKMRAGEGYTSVNVRLEVVAPLCRDKETPRDCLRRIVHKALVRAAAK